MQPAPNSKKQCRRGAILALVFFDLLVLYALSYGPAWWLFTHGWLAGETAEVIYAPVDWLYEHCPTPVQESMQSYIDMWGDPPVPQRRRRR